ncbi:MAG: guanylate kinase [Desulfonatronovibrio sp.]|nr:guanylate kinase [Desulfovibrionales bacterium]
MNKGLLLIISAPSGAGKSTLINMLIREYPWFGFSISYTTRTPRPGEVNGRDYYFVDHEQFISLKKENFFAEWAEVHGNFYGTPSQMVLEAVNAGQSLIFDIDIQGAAQLKNNLNMGVSVFILPPSLQQLEQRLVKRGSDNMETIEKRLRNARQEITESRIFDYWLVNDNLQKALDDLKAIVRCQMLRPFHNPELAGKIFESSNGLKHE